MIFGAVDLDRSGVVRLVLDTGAEWSGPAQSLAGELARHAKAARREHLRVLCADLDELARIVARSLDLDPDAIRLGDAGLASLSLGPRVRLVSPAPLIPGGVLDELEGGAAQLLDAAVRVHRVMADALGVEPSTSLGRMAGEGVALLGRRWSYPEPQGGPITRAARECLHGGLVGVFHDGDSVAVAGADFPREWFGEPAEVLPAGWTLRDEDRSSAYAAEASAPLPSVWGPAYADAGAAGGALVECTIDLNGWRGVALPVRIRRGREVVQIEATAGAWRGWWASPIVDYASSRGARIDVHQAIGWRHADRYLQPGMAALFSAKQRHACGTVERAALTAAMQRAVGRLARREPVDLVFRASEFQEWSYADLEARGIVGDLGRWAGYAFARTAPAESTPRGTCPVWPAFVVGRAWVSLCERIEAVRAAGGRALYCDTDGLLWAKPPGPALELGDGPGEWQLRGLPEWAWCERAKLYARGIGSTISAAACSGIPRADLIWYLEGGDAPTRRESIREQAARRAEEAQAVKRWKERKERQTRPVQAAPKSRRSRRG